MMQNIIDTSVCSKTQSLMNINELENVTLSLEHITENNHVIPSFLKLNDILLNYSSLIAEGTYGSIYSYKNEEKNIGVALKYFIAQDDNEIMIIKKLKETKNNLCNNYNILNNVVKIHKFDNLWHTFTYVIMNQLQGSLSDLKSSTKITEKSVINILYNLTHYLNCLQGMGFYYNDIKLQNILYYCTQTGEYNITLGDIGSIVEEISGGSPRSYIVPDFCYLDSLFCFDANKIIVWQLGLLVIELLAGDDDSIEDLFSESSNYMNCYEMFNPMLTTSYEIINRMSDNNFKSLLLKMLELDYKDRIWMADIIHELDKILKQQNYIDVKLINIPYGQMETLIKTATHPVKFNIINNGSEQLNDIYKKMNLIREVLDHLEKNIVDRYDYDLNTLNKLLHNSNALKCEFKKYNDLKDFCDHESQIIKNKLDEKKQKCAVLSLKLQDIKHRINDNTKQVEDMNLIYKEVVNGLKSDPKIGKLIEEIESFESDQNQSGGISNYIYSKNKRKYFEIIKINYQMKTISTF